MMEYSLITIITIAISVLFVVVYAAHEWYINFFIVPNIFNKDSGLQYDVYEKFVLIREHSNTWAYYAFYLIIVSFVLMGLDVILVSEGIR